MQVPENPELVGAETPVPALLPEAPVEPHDATPDPGGFGEVIREVIHEDIVRSRLLYSWRRTMQGP
jgi:hypothetical protein